MTPPPRTRAYIFFQSGSFLVPPSPRVSMDVLANHSIFQELQLVHDTGYFSAMPSLEENWQQVRLNFYFFFLPSSSLIFHTLADLRAHALHGNMRALTFLFFLFLSKTWMCAVLKGKEKINRFPQHPYISWDVRTRRRLIQLSTAIWWDVDVNPKMESEMNCCK